MGSTLSLLVFGDHVVAPKPLRLIRCCLVAEPSRSKVRRSANFQPGFDLGRNPLERAAASSDGMARVQTGAALGACRERCRDLEWRLQVRSRTADFFVVISAMEVCLSPVSPFMAVRGAGTVQKGVKIWILFAGA